MGRSRTPKYRVEVVRSIGSLSNMSWSVQDYGIPTAENLARFVRSMNESFETGGANEYLSGIKILEARLICQKTDEVKASWVDSDTAVPAWFGKNESMEDWL